MPPKMAIECTSLSKCFGNVHAVRDVSIGVRTGARFGLVGANGAGKTTLLRMLSGALEPTSGEVRVSGSAMHPDAVDAKRQIGTMVESLGSCELLTGEEYLHFVGSIYGVGMTEIQRRTRELLALLNLEPDRRRRIADYSAGMKKLIGFAGVLVHDPAVLILDEPFSGIDPVGREVIRHTLSRIAELGGTVLITSHVLEIVEELCDEVSVMHGGEIALSSERQRSAGRGRLREIFASLRNEESRGGENLAWLGDDWEKGA